MISQAFLNSLLSRLTSTSCYINGNCFKEYRLRTFYVLCANMVLAPIEMIQREFQSSSKLIKKQMSHFPCICSLELLLANKTKSFSSRSQLKFEKFGTYLCVWNNLYCSAMKSSCLSSNTLHLIFFL